MYKNYYFLILITLFLGCSPSQDDEIQEPESGTPSTIENKYLLKITGDDDVKFHYEDGLLVKGVGNSSSDNEFYYAAFQVEYNSNNTVDRVILSHKVSISKPADFSFDLINSGSEDGLDIYTYNYKNEKLHTLTVSGEIDSHVVEFFYDDQGKVIKTKIHEENGTYGESSIKYDSDGKMIGYDAYHSGTNKTVYGEIKSDDQANPLYVFWKNHSFVMPTIYSYFLDNNPFFYPHNITAVYTQEEKEYGVKHIKYEEGYPIIYDLEVEDYGTMDTDPMRFIYLD